jgi:hypothetical protein
MTHLMIQEIISTESVEQLVVEELEKDYYSYNPVN